MSERRERASFEEDVKANQLHSFCSLAPPCSIKNAPRFARCSLKKISKMSKKEKEKEKEKETEKEACDEGRLVATEKKKEVSQRSEAKRAILLEDEHTRDESREIATDIMATSAKWLQT